MFPLQTPASFFCICASYRHSLLLHVTMITSFNNNFKKRKVVPYTSAQKSRRKLNIMISALAEFCGLQMTQNWLLVARVRL